MEEWLKISLMLCSFGFFRELRPSEPYVTEFLAGDFRNLTSEQIYQEVFPFGTYAVLCQLVIVFLITDLVRYKPVIVLSAVAGIVLFTVLTWTRTLFMLQVGQVFYGFFTAAEVAYYTYIYAKVDKEHYQIVTGHIRAAILAGKFLGGVLAQILVSTESMDFRELHYISFTTQIISLVVSLTLPSVSRTLYFYAMPEEAQGQGDPPKCSVANAGRLLAYHFVSSYRNPVVLVWSLWWAVGSCGLILVVGYIQFLWKEVAPDHVSIFNGAVEATATFLGAVGALLAGLLQSNKRRMVYMLALSIGAAVLGALLIIASRSQVIWIVYLNYVIFCAIFYFMITVAGAVVASNLVEDSYGLIFGINTLVALILQSLIVIAFIDSVGFGLPPRDQYVVFGCLFLVLSVIYIIGLGIVFLKMLSRETAPKKVL